MKTEKNRKPINKILIETSFPKITIKNRDLN